MTERARPLSPHLQIYRFTLTMAMSIIHRVTGVTLYLGMLVLALWLGAAALGGPWPGITAAIFAFWPVRIMLFLLTWVLFHHMLGGIRHFIWDAGQALDPKTREWLVRGQLAGSTLLTLGAWVLFMGFN